MCDIVWTCSLAEQSSVCSLGCLVAGRVGQSGWSSLPCNLIEPAILEQSIPQLTWELAVNWKRGHVGVSPMKKYNLGNASQAELCCPKCCGAQLVSRQARPGSPRCAVLCCCSALAGSAAALLAVAEQTPLPQSPFSTAQHSPCRTEWSCGKVTLTLIDSVTVSYRVTQIQATDVNIPPDWQQALTVATNSDIEIIVSPPDLQHSPGYPGLVYCIVLAQS